LIRAALQSPVLEDRVEQRRHNLSYGVVLGEVPFWEWMSGKQGLTHAWTACRAPAIVAKMLLKTPVDVVMFDQGGPRQEHPVWTSILVQAVVWSRDGRGQHNMKAPDGWATHLLFYHHQELGGMTDGAFHVWVAMRETVQYQPPRDAVGVCPML
jgi:hypothetical protein